MEFGLQRCQTNHSIFHLHTSAGYILLVVYVDDIVIIGDDSRGIAQFKLFLQQMFTQTKIIFWGLKLLDLKQASIYPKENMYLIY
jgi:hypothetical protein